MHVANIAIRSLNIIIQLACCKHSNTQFKYYNTACTCDVNKRIVVTTFATKTRTDLTEEHPTTPILTTFSARSHNNKMHRRKAPIEQVTPPQYTNIPDLS